MLDKTIHLTQLYDWYAPLMTEKQREVFELYYHDNLSLAEIAADHGVSRTAVHDILIRTENQLSRYEEALGLAYRLGQTAALVLQAEAMGNVLAEVSEPQARARIRSMKEIVQALSDVWTGEYTGEGL